jgi:hypothetical protein
MPNDSWKRPPGGFRYRHNSPAGHVERAVAAFKQPNVRRWVITVAVVTVLLIVLTR